MSGVRLRLRYAIAVTACFGVLAVLLLYGFPHSHSRIKLKVDRHEGTAKVSSRRNCQKIWHKQFALRNTSSFTFGFFNRPGFMALFKEAERRKWSIQRAASPNLASLKSMDLIFTHPSAYEAYPVLSQLNHTQHMISAVKGMQAAWGSKNTQARMLAKYATTSGCDWSNIRFLPRTYILSDPNQCKKFFSLSDVNTNVWILKPSSSYGGQGIRIVKGNVDIEEMKEEFYPCRRYHSKLSDNRFVVQEYIMRPLLLHGRKFDVRMYMLLGSTKPTVLFYRPGYIRASLTKYNITSIKDLSGHLTNTHVQGAAKTNFSGHVDEHFWSLHQFQAYLDKHWSGNAKSKNFVNDCLVPFVKNAALYVYHAGRKKIIRSPGTFQLVGLDVMVDEEFNCWFIEANNYPLWPYQGHFASTLSLDMAKDLFDLVLSLHTEPSKFSNTKPGDSINSFELLLSEIHDCKQKKAPLFNPCEAFALRP